MIQVDCKQGTEAWLKARLGVLTASEFNKIITSKLRLSGSANDYIKKLYKEWLSGKPDANRFRSKWIDRGIEMEDEARNLYASKTGYEPILVGLCLEDGGRYGCSPDALISLDGGFETKCPSMGVHAKYLGAGVIPTVYRTQVWGSLLVTRRKWWDFMSYYPGMEPLIIRTWRKDIKKELSKLEAALCGFHAKLQQLKETAS